MLDLDSVDLGHGADDPVEMGRVAGEHGHIAHLFVTAHANQVDRAEKATRARNRLRESCERPWLVLQVHAQRRAERGRRMG